MRLLLHWQRAMFLWSQAIYICNQSSSGEIGQRKHWRALLVDVKVKPLFSSVLGDDRFEWSKVLQGSAPWPEHVALYLIYKRRTVLVQIPCSTLKYIWSWARLSSSQNIVIIKICFIYIKMQFTKWKVKKKTFSCIFISTFRVFLIPDHCTSHSHI